MQKNTTVIAPEDPRLCWSTYYGDDANEKSSVLTSEYKLPAHVAFDPTQVGLYHAFTLNYTKFAPLNSSIANLGSYEIFVSKFDGNAVRSWATWFGGSGVDYSHDLVAGYESKLYLFGRSLSIDLPVPNPNEGTFYQSKGKGFIAQFDKTDGKLKWLTRIGGTYPGGSTNYPTTVIAAAADNLAQRLYVTGEYKAGVQKTNITSQTPNTDYFPLKFVAGRYNQNDLGGNAQQDYNGAYIMEFNTIDNSLEWSTLFCSRFWPMTIKMARADDGSENHGQNKSTNWETGKLYIAGVASSNPALYPASYPSPQTAPVSNDKVPLANPGNGAYFKSSSPVVSGNTYEGFVAGFNKNLELEWSTFFGGAKNESITSIGSHKDGGIVIGGFTSSDVPTSSSSIAQNTNEFPVFNPGGGAYFQGTYGGGRADNFIARFNNLYQLTWSSYFGSPNDEMHYPSAYHDGGSYAPRVKTDSKGNIIFGSYTAKVNSINIPFSNNNTSVPFNVIQPNSYFQGQNASVTTPDPSGYYGCDATVSLFNSNNNLHWSTFFGGAALGQNANVNNIYKGDEQLEDIALIDGKRIYAAMRSESWVTPMYYPGPQSYGPVYYVNQFTPTSNNGYRGNGVITCFPYTSFASSSIAATASKKVQTLTVFPNPATQSINIGLISDQYTAAQLKVYNVLGAEILYNTNILRIGSNQINISVENWASGTYFVTIKTKNNEYQSQFIKL